MSGYAKLVFPFLTEGGELDQMEMRFDLDPYEDFGAFALMKDNDSVAVPVPDAEGWHYVLSLQEQGTPYFDTNGDVTQEYLLVAEYEDTEEECEEGHETDDADRAIAAALKAVQFSAASDE